MTVDMEEAVKAYIKLREERDKERNEYERRDETLKMAMSEIEQYMLRICNETKAESIKTAAGTVMKSIKERYWTKDWDTFYPLVRENPELLEKRIQQSNFKAYLQEHLHGELPPGVNVQREYAITVRKSNGVTHE